MAKLSSLVLPCISTTSSDEFAGLGRELNGFCFAFELPWKKRRIRTSGSSEPKKPGLRDLARRKMNYGRALERDLLPSWGDV